MNCLVLMLSEETKLSLFTVICALLTCLDNPEELDIFLVFVDLGSFIMFAFALAFAFLPPMILLLFLETLSLVCDLRTL